VGENIGFDRRNPAFFAIGLMKPQAGNDSPDFGPALNSMS